jgi:hypothetical protein
MAFAGTIETVRGRIGDELAGRLVRFWVGHGALDEEQARGRLAEVVCVAFDADGEIAGVNSAFERDVPPIGRRFWVYRSFLPGAADASPEMIEAAFEALADGFEPYQGGPLGLCVLVTDPEEMRRRPQAVWPENAMLFAGYTPDGAQLRIRYFDDAPIGPGEPHSLTTQQMRELVIPRAAGYDVVRFAETAAVSGEDVIEFWEREGAVSGAEARRRVQEVSMVAITADSQVAAVSTAYLQRNEQLRMDLWYYRGYVGREHRHNSLASHFVIDGRDHLEQRFVSGEDRRGAGIIFEIENTGIRTFFNKGLWVTSGYWFIGENERGDHVRVHFFAGAEVPPPS